VRGWETSRNVNYTENIYKMNVISLPITRSQWALRKQNDRKKTRVKTRKTRAISNSRETIQLW